MAPSSIGEFEQLILLAVLQRGDQAFGLEVRQEIETSARRKISRGAFYTTLDRLEQKGFLRWEEQRPADPARPGPLRRFSVTPAGLKAVREAYRAVRNLSRGLDDLLEDM